MGRLWHILEYSIESEIIMIGIAIGITLLSLLEIWANKGLNREQSLIVLLIMWLTILVGL